MTRLLSLFMNNFDLGLMVREQVFVYPEPSKNILRVHFLSSGDHSLLTSLVCLVAGPELRGVRAEAQVVREQVRQGQCRAVL